MGKMKRASVAYETTSSGQIYIQMESSKVKQKKGNEKNFLNTNFQIWWKL